MRVRRVPFDLLYVYISSQDHTCIQGSVSPVIWSVDDTKRLPTGSYSSSKGSAPTKQCSNSESKYSSSPYSSSASSIFLCFWVMFWTELTKTQQKQFTVKLGVSEDFLNHTVTKEPGREEVPHFYAVMGRWLFKKIWQKNGLFLTLTNVLDFSFLSTVEPF